MFTKEAISDGVTELARTVVELGLATLTAIVVVHKSRSALAAFEQLYVRALTKWRTDKASYAGFVIKVMVAFLVDHFLLEPLVRAFTLRFLPGAQLAGGIASWIAPVPVIVAECAIAVRFARARAWERHFGTRRDATRWLALGLVVAALPAIVVITLGMLSTAATSIFGWPALAGRHALNVVLGVVSFALHLLLLCSGETPRDVVDAALAVRGVAARERVVSAAETAAQRRHGTLITAATRYESARRDYEAAHGALPAYPFPMKVLALVRSELPDFARPGTADLPLGEHEGTA